MPGFSITTSKRGYVELSDGTKIDIRVIILNIEEGKMKPVGPDLQVDMQVTFIVNSPTRLKNLVRNKPLPPSDQSYLEKLEIWEIMDIVNKESAVEECLYDASDGKKYRISVEVSVTIVARTLEYRDKNNNPIYHLRWTPCVKIFIA